VLVVSHNIGAIRRMCDSAVVMNAGRKDYQGETADAISRYHEILQEQRDVDDDSDELDTPIEEGAVEVLDVSLVGASGDATHHVNGGERVTVRADVRPLRDVAHPFAGVSITSGSGVRVYTDTNMRRQRFPALRTGQVATLAVSFPAALATGSYSLALVLAQLKEDGSAARFCPDRLIDFYVAGRPLVHGVADLGATFDTADPQQRL
jgi:lipopolysaccharide transport system ATP-binding protein